MGNIFSNDEADSSGPGGGPEQHPIRGLLDLLHQEMTFFMDRVCWG